MNNDRKKVQASIFDFAAKKVEVGSLEGPNLIDLTGDDEFGVLDKIILCPICNIDITCNLADDRIRHVEFCLQRDLKRSGENEEVEHKKERVSPSKKPKLLPVQKERISYVNKVSAVGVIKGEEQLFINETSEVNLDMKQEIGVSSLDDPIKPPTTINNTAYKRKPIPKLKTLSFPITSTKNYDLSVDAFNYAPHPKINQYILTHFHGDHYGGISKKWAYERIFATNDCDYSDASKYRKIIYCTKITGSLLTIRFKIDSRFIKKLDFDCRYIIKKFNADEIDDDLPDGGYESDENVPGVYVTPINANHCPGAAIFLFESISLTGYKYYSLHCGDFRVNKEILTSPLLKKFSIEGGDTLLNNVYLDTTYLSPEYTFPKQESVCESVAQMFQDLIQEQPQQQLFSTWFGMLKQSRITDFMTKLKAKKKKFLILVGTYLIGKEKLAIAILKKLKCPIYILSIKSRDDKTEIIRNYEDEYLDSVITHNDVGNDDNECVVHLVPMNIVGSTKELNNYFNHNKYFESFERCVGLRPTGWSFANRWAKYEPDFSNDDTSLTDLVHTLSNCQSYSYISDILPQTPVSKGVAKGKDRPETALIRIYALPYSEHSSYRELSYFGIFYNTDNIIPTVNFENEESRNKMAAIIRLWELFRKIKLENKQPESVSPNTCDSVTKITLDSF